MAEVFALQNGNKTRPLGELKETKICFDEEGNQIIKERSQQSETFASTRRKTKHNFKRMKELQDSIGRSNVIHLVTSNKNSSSKESHSQKQTATELLSNTMAVISNLVLNKDRAISIPVRQGYCEAMQLKPRKIKKNSENVEPRAHFESRSKTFVCLDDELNIKNRVVRFPNDVVLKTNGVTRRDQIKLKISAPKTPLEKQRQVLRMTKGHLKNLSKIENVMTTPLAKCDAVDILESKAKTEYMQMATCATLGQLKKSSAVNKYSPICNELKPYRAKSLPSIFPIRKNKTSTSNQETTNRNSNNLNLNQNMKENGPTNIFRSNTFCNKGFSQVSDSKNNSPKMAFRSNENIPATGKLNTDEYKSEEPDIRTEVGTMQDSAMNGKTGNNRNANSNITLEGCSFSSGISAFKTALKSRGKYDVISPTINIDEQLKTNTNCTENDYRHAEINKSLYSARLNGKNMRSTKSAPEFSPVNEDGTLLMKRLNSSSKEGIATTASFGCCQKVKFDESALYKIERSKTTFDNEDVNDLSMLKATGVANTLFNTPGKPMTLELMKLREKILMRRFSNKIPVRRYQKDSMQISRMNSCPCINDSLLKHDGHSEYSENNSDFLVHMDIEMYGDPDVTNRTSTQVPKGFGASSFYPDRYSEHMYGDYDDCFLDNEDILDDDYDYDNDSIDENTVYRMVKAIDLGTLSGYQHRKFRKPNVKETTATHFVKIRMKEN